MSQVKPVCFKLTLKHCRYEGPSSTVPGSEFQTAGAEWRHRICWNNLPVQLRDSEPALLRLRWLLKTHLFCWVLLLLDLECLTNSHLHYIAMRIEIQHHARRSWLFGTIMIKRTIWKKDRDRALYMRLQIHCKQSGRRKISPRCA